MVQSQRLARAAESLSGVAKRVLDAVPISEPWTATAICSELGRHGSRVDFNIVLGCLNTHKQAGLVKEPMTQYFQRVYTPEMVKQKPIPAAPATNVVPLMSDAPEKLTERDPLESIGAMAQRLREAGRALLMWAEDLERLGIEYESRVDQAGKDGEKLRQLQTILNSLR